jgi:uncharacterized protein YecT (DUF1311 family)
MLYLEHVGDDHQLFTRYLPEPILAEASAQVTGKYGWELPLDCLLYKIQHGVVDGGFRGEFVTKALLCIACEDAQRAWEKERDKELPDWDSDSDDSTENPASWTYSTPVTVRKFLNSLFQLPTMSTEQKHSGAGHKVNADSAKKSKDAVPADDSFTREFLLPALQSPTRETHHLSDKDDEISSFLDGTVFFNHWIRTSEVIRPSVLVKAWNRNAVLICKDGLTGIDFVIPMMRSWSQIKDAETHLGKCTTGKWTDPQQATASEIISYILIQTKTRTKSKPHERLADIVDAVPLDPLDKLEGALKRELLVSRCCISGEGEAGNESEAE